MRSALSMSPRVGSCQSYRLTALLRVGPRRQAWRFSSPRRLPAVSGGVHRMLSTSILPGECSHQLWVCLKRLCYQEHFYHFIIWWCQGKGARIRHRFYVTEALNCLSWLVCTSGNRVSIIWWGRRSTSRFLLKGYVFIKSGCFCFCFS